MNTFFRSKLKNGLEVVLIPQKNAPATAILTIVRAGSQHESKKINGISHFLEHLAFNGSQKHPSALDISRELDTIGAEYNAFTSQEITAFYAKIRNSFAEKALSIIADLYLNPVLDSGEIEKERGVIIEEINMYEDIPMKKVIWQLLELMYKGQPAGMKIIGPKENIRRISRKDLLDYRKNFYNGRNTIVVISGGFGKKDVSKIRKSIGEKFRNLKQGKPSSLPPIREAQKKSEISILQKKSDQTHIAIGFRAFNAFDNRKFALAVLSHVLGGSMSSRLFLRIRGELGAAYYINSSADTSPNSGLVLIRAGVSNEKAKIAVEAILEECKKLKEEVVSPDEIKKAKNHLLGTMMLGLEGSDDVGFYYGSQIASGLKPMTPQEMVKKINAVTAVELQSVAKEIFVNKNLNIAAIGPLRKNIFSDIIELE